MGTMFRADYEFVYLVGLVLTYAVRHFYGLKFRARGVKEPGQKSILDRVMTRVAELGFVSGILYLFTDWLTFASYPVVTWLGWSAIPVFGFGLWLLWAAHRDLDQSWSPHVEIRRDQKLITGGVYRYIRHPMYAGYFLLGIGQCMMLANWVAGPSFLLLFGLLYLQRVSQEEAMMLSKFGEEYRIYMQHTGRILPRITLKASSQPEPFLTSTKK